MRRRTKAAVMAVAAAGLAVLAGCQFLSAQRPAGRSASLDMFTYESTGFLPQTVTLVDTRDQQPLWSVDVPVGWRLILRFYDSPSAGEIRNPEEMRWALVPQTTRTTGLPNRVPAPPAWARRLDVSYRDTPEPRPEELGIEVFRGEGAEAPPRPRPQNALPG